MSAEDHKKHAKSSLKCAILTISDTRTHENDESGKLIKDLLIDNGHTISDYKILKDDKELIKSAVNGLVPQVDVIITNGGTGISKRDVTYEAVSESLDRRLDGFGELFRYLSYEQIGSAAILSRAIAGSVNNSIVIAIPGSPEAVKLAMEKLILPEIGHITWELNKD